MRRWRRPKRVHRHAEDRPGKSRGGVRSARPRHPPGGLAGDSARQLARCALSSNRTILTLPAENDVRVVEDPVFNRQTTLAAITARASSSATQAYYYVTPGRTA